MKYPKEELLTFLRHHPGSSRAQIAAHVGMADQQRTLRRTLHSLVDEGLLAMQGSGRGIAYSLSAKGKVMSPLDLDAYFDIDIDQRKIQNTFDQALIRDILPQVKIFNADEMALLQQADARFRSHLASLDASLYRKEMERFGIDLSWKSSQIEGNTYSLLETERLLRDRETAVGKTREEAEMLLNHKEALKFILDDKDYYRQISSRKVIELHSILTRNLGVETAIRHRRVGITGTNYTPLDNEWQIRESIEDMCALINATDDVFAKALLALLLISYIQPFNDGNKRTSRLISNAILLAYGHCPVSYRSVDTIDYKKAMLVFYEQTSLQAFKHIFITQYCWAVDTYF